MWQHLSALSNVQVLELVVTACCAVLCVMSCCPPGARRLLRWEQRLKLHASSGQVVMPEELKVKLAVSAAELQQETGLSDQGLQYLLAVAGDRYVAGCGQHCQGWKGACCVVLLNQLSQVLHAAAWHAVREGACRGVVCCFWLSLCCMAW